MFLTPHNSLPTFTRQNGFRLPSHYPYFSEGVNAKWCTAECLVRLVTTLMSSCLDMIRWC
ncbi:hypothetical protein P154DRAFT_516746 [Amniculicola lignicola CBS 123094]|uniref:Uncharacterized protein n=1 Tax=Amniculicola lignicola CBS 123094 TaxID=1392246 RepID=A0A6A5WGS4_9PLEO|nr:hypothetical protein P154DRAFT_527136 [Amniculicola lignicola CBS 123094]KAF1995969.1 hypothetical protein P154DRAFT_525918 [Amniculicola lignicola CBS 123094]KAF1995972.1 hypothetical protein P154DRAFT_525923 [Amniculicola lignicola CBS 123094]KAF1996435.1 hypothetical protein P154DRAFT_525569 [Amniculicola lignicola CBS 123094]KAF1997264.1 hypothetical protein P154DRAFT_524914 [Amniculicola lignicola CBS 123094]